MRPVDGGSFVVTEDAIVDFCAQRHVQIDSEIERLEELTLRHGIFTNELFKRLVEVSIPLDVCLVLSVSHRKKMQLRTQKVLQMLADINSFV